MQDNNAILAAMARIHRDNAKDQAPAEASELNDAADKIDAIRRVGTLESLLAELGAPTN